MAGNDVIRTPWKHKWRRFRYSVMPMLSFIACCALTLWLWDRQGRMPNAVGEVEVVRLDIVALADGTLVPLDGLPQGQWTLFDSVQERWVVAQLDDRSARAELEMLRKEVLRLQGELDAAAQTAAVDEADRQLDYRRDRNRLVLEIERRRLDALDRKALIEADRVELQRLSAQVDFLEPSYQTGAVNEIQMAEAKLLRDQTAKRIEENTTALREAENQQRRAEQQLDGYPPLVEAVLDRLMAPIRASIAAQEALIRQIQFQIESLEIRSPISGTICFIHRWPGQNVRAGDPILTIGRDHGRYIVSYVRQEQRIPLAEKTKVDVRVRAPGSRPVATKVESVGPQVEPIPSHLLRDPNVPEWGLPVRIVIPDGFSVCPGELVDVTFGT